MNTKFSIAIHGGAGTILKSQMTIEKEAAYTAALTASVAAGIVILKAGGTALDAVESAIISLENCPLFNAGKGSVFTFDGNHEMDASLMRGDTLEAGAVAGVKHIMNPIALAKQVMLQTEHVLLMGDGAAAFAKSIHQPMADKDYFYDEFRHQQWLQVKDTGKTQMDHVDEKKFGTVGCVALDMHGNLAAGTSTGGMTNKKYGRVGDTPLIGCGTYANNTTCAVSCTGHGEFFMRSVVAYDVACVMEYKGYSLQAACDYVVQQKLKKLGGEGGLIAIDKDGNIELCFNSDGMYRAYSKSDGIIKVAIYK